MGGGYKCEVWLVDFFLLVRWEDAPESGISEASASRPGEDSEGLEQG